MDAIVIGPFGARKTVVGSQIVRGLKKRKKFWAPFRASERAEPGARTKDQQRPRFPVLPSSLGVRRSRHSRRNALSSAGVRSFLKDNERTPIPVGCVVWAGRAPRGFAAGDRSG
jgi:hypothetical protein